MNELATGGRSSMESHNGHLSSNGHGMHSKAGHNPQTLRFSTTAPMLFQVWSISSITGLVLAMVATTAFAFVYEGLRYYVYVHNAFDMRKEKCPKKARKYELLSQMTGSFLHMLHFFTGYILMLAVMTYNAWIFLSLILGASLGYFFIRPMLENHFRVHRGKRITCGKQGLLMNNGRANGEVKEMTTYNFNVNNNVNNDKKGVNTNGSCISNKHREGQKGVLYYGAKEELCTEDRVSVV